LANYTYYLYIFYSCYFIWVILYVVYFICAQVRTLQAQSGTQVLSRKRIAKLFRICWIMLHNQKCTGMDAGARRYAPWTAHKSRFRQA